MAARKRVLRRELRAALDGLSAQARAQASGQIVSQLRVLARFSESLAVALYAPLPGEVDVGPLLAERWSRGAPVWLPRMREDGGLDFVAVRSAGELSPTRYGVREPAPGLAATPLRELRLLVIPGLGFDRRGVRLGRGGGFYDRSVGGVPIGARPRTVGVAFACQRVDELPAAAHDLRVDTVLTEHGTLDPR